MNCNLNYAVRHAVCLDDVIPIHYDQIEGSLMFFYVFSL